MCAPRCIKMEINGSNGFAWSIVLSARNHDAHSVFLRVIIFNCGSVPPSRASLFALSAEMRASNPSLTRDDLSVTPVSLAAFSISALSMSRIIFTGNIPSLRVKTCLSIVHGLPIVKKPHVPVSALPTTCRLPARGSPGAEGSESVAWKGRGLVGAARVLP